MNHDDRRRFLEALNALADVYRSELTESAIRAFWWVLSPYPLAEVDRAAGRWLASGRRMPAPGELKEIIAGNDEDQAIVAWGAVLGALKRHGAYCSVRFDDDRVTEAIRTLGGWVNLCRTHGDKLHTWTRKEFIRAFLAAGRRGMGPTGDGQHLVGLLGGEPVDVFTAARGPVRQLSDGLGEHRKQAMRWDLIDEGGRDV